MADTLTLPPATPWSAPSSSPVDGSHAAPVPRRLPMLPLRIVAVFAAAVAVGLAGWQVTRAMNGEDRLSIVTSIEIALALVAAAATVVWTWVVVENARRLLVVARTSDPPSPGVAAASWAMPMIVAASAVAAVGFLERRLNSPEIDSTSAVPLGLACAALIVTLFVSYRPLFVLSAVMRRLGGGVGDLARWVWVPISLVVAGAATLVALRFGGGYGDDFDGFAPAWAIGVASIPPVVIVLSLAWRGCGLVEDAVVRAYGRRSGRHSAGIGRRGFGFLARALRADARPPIHRDVRRRVRLLPGTSMLRVAVMTSVAALTLISIVGALVMFLFWREATDGPLLPAERERAWDALAALQSIERRVAVIALGVATIWSFVNVLNARLASGRRRNPLLAAVAWPAAGVAIWKITERYGDSEEIGPLVIRFALQVAVLAVPFLLLERAAIAVGSRRSPFRLAYGLGVVLLVHIQGLGGLATLVVDDDVDRFGRTAGYLALAALLELIATVAVAEASRMIGDASRSVADKHNFLADQRSQMAGQAAVTSRADRSFPSGTASTEPSSRAPVTTPSVAAIASAPDVETRAPAFAPPAKPAPTSAVFSDVAPVASVGSDVTSAPTRIPPLVLRPPPPSPDVIAVSSAASPDG